MKIIRTTKDGKDVLEFKKSPNGPGMIHLNGAVFCDPCTLFDLIIETFAQSRSASYSWRRRKIMAKLAQFGNNLWVSYY